MSRNTGDTRKMHIFRICRRSPSRKQTLYRHPKNLHLSCIARIPTQVQRKKTPKRAHVFFLWCICMACATAQEKNRKRFLFWFCVACGVADGERWHLFFFRGSIMGHPGFMTDAFFRKSGGRRNTPASLVSGAPSLARQRRFCASPSPLSTWDKGGGFVKRHVDKKPVVMVFRHRTIRRICKAARVFLVGNGFPFSFRCASAPKGAGRDKFFGPWCATGDQGKECSGVFAFFSHREICFCGLGTDATKKWQR